MPADRGGQRRRNKPTGDQDQVQEQDQEQVVETTTEQEQQRDTPQDQLGNQGITEMLGMPSVKPGSGGVGMADARRHESESELDFGGDDDIPVDAPLTLDDITRSWNQGTKRGKDRATFEEPMPASDLPEEEAAFVRAVKGDPDPPELPSTWTQDGLVQPSEATVTGDLQRWVAEAVRWGGRGLDHRSLAALVQPAAPCLQDPDGRVLLSRSRVAALCTLLVLDGPAMSAGEPDPVRAGFVNLCLELAGRHHIVLEVFHQVQNSDVKLPVARDVLEPMLAARRPSQVRPEPLGRRAATHLQWVLDGLLDLPSATTLLPALPTRPTDDADDDDDPLGLDAVLEEYTGGPADPQSGLYDAALQAAERLAARCARLRVRLCGVSMAVAEACDLWSSGAPTRNLLWVADQADRNVDRGLQLLVEVARAAQHRRVAPKGIRNGLRRVARMLDKTQATAVTQLAAVIGGVLPAEPELPDLYDPDIDDRLGAAWADGRPLDALPWLRARPDGLERDTALVLTRALAGQTPSSLLEPLREVQERARASHRPLLAAAAEVIEGPCCLWTGEIARARELSGLHVALGRDRRNGALVCSGGLLGMEAMLADDEPEAADILRRDAAKLCWHLGDRAGFTLLARWRPGT